MRDRLDAEAELLELLEDELRDRTENKLAYYAPYKQQMQFHTGGALFRERLFMAGNQLGKTFAGAFEVAMHLTGEYPGWWQGRRFKGPVTILAGSETAELTRDGVQRLLVGPPAVEADWGTGAIPKRCLVDWSRRQGVADALDTVTVLHKSGKNSTVSFKSYDQGRKKWQAATVHFVWFDEEPPMDVYSEGLTRITATNGCVAVTFTPLLGMSEVVSRYINEKSPDRTYVQMQIEDADHIAPEERQKIIDGYPAHQRNARSKGIPMLGEGVVFQVDESVITVEPFDIPEYFWLIGGIDFGIDHPTAGVLLAWDKDADIVYITREYREKDGNIPTHASGLRRWGARLPWAWPHDGHQRDKGSGKTLASQYRDEGLVMLGEHATDDEGTQSVEATVSVMFERMQSGRLKVFSTCVKWLEEFRMYHRKKGMIVAERDDLISASRYGTMMLRKARIARSCFDLKKRRQTARVAPGTDFNVLG